jgi:hypothetical protein
MKIYACLMVGIGLVAILLGLLMPDSTLAGSEFQTCNVPDDYGTIQSAVTDPSCTELVVGNGTMYETVTITRTVKIKGQGPNATSVDGFASSSVFFIDGSSVPTMSVTLEGLTIKNGSSNFGGGIYNIKATLTLTNSNVSGNWASSQGGGIFSNLGKLNIVNSNIFLNDADTGGGIYVDSGAVTIEESSIKDNDAGFHAGSLYNREGDVTLEKASVTGNTTYVDGGGIFNHGTMTINNSSINNNESSNYSGGGVRNEGTTYINNSTISNNKAVVDEAGIDNESGVLRLSSSTVANNFGGGIGSRGSDVRIQNSIVSGNSPDDCRGTIHSNGYNLIKDTSSCDYQSGIGDSVGTTANLGSLEGVPGYHSLLLGPGINAGDPNGCKNHQGQLLATDQRGMPRVGRCDIGAYEFQGEFHQVFIPTGFNDYCPDFFDNFSNPLSGWPIGEDDYVRFGYLSGEYQIRSKKADFFYLFDSPSCLRENYVVEVDARWVGAPGSGYGIIFGIDGDFDRYYLFDINTDLQMFRLLYRSPSGWETLIFPTTSNAINSGNAINHLKVIRNGTEITLGVNSTTLRVINDNRINGLIGAGIVSQPYDNQPNSDARFDNFSMSTLVANSGSSLESGVTVESDGLRPNWNSFVPVPREFDWETNLKN